MFRDRTQLWDVDRQPLRVLSASDTNEMMQSASNNYISTPAAKKGMAPATPSKSQQQGALSPPLPKKKVLPQASSFTRETGSVT